MIAYLKSKIANLVINKRLRNKSVQNRSFKNLLSKCSNLFIIMPEEEVDFQNSKQVLKFLKEKDKRLTTLNFDFRVTDLQFEHLNDSIAYGLVDYSKINLPSKKLANNLNQKEFDAVIDLNRGENLFCSFAANLVHSDIIIGFRKNNSDKYYNIQINDIEDNPEISYKNFINCLQMF